MTTTTETYTLVAEPADGGGWGVYALELPGVVALGETRSAALDNWGEALALHAEDVPVRPATQIHVERRSISVTR